MMKKTIATLASVAMLLFAAPAQACSCMMMDTLEALDASDVTFVGKVTRPHAISLVLDILGIEQNITLEVTRAWKGVRVGDRVRVRAVPSLTMCGFSVNRSDTWLVSLNGPPYSLGSTCEAAYEADMSAEKIKKLDEATTPLVLPPLDLSPKPLDLNPPS